MTARIVAMLYCIIFLSWGFPEAIVWNCLKQDLLNGIDFAFWMTAHLALKFRRKQRNLERADRQRGLFPFEPHARTASGSDVRTVPVTIEPHIF
jgi:hypothetical protein